MTDQRTIKQNSSLHSYFSQLADELNGAGYDVRTTIKVPVSFTPENVKEYMAVPIMAVLYPDKAREDGSFHTSDLDTQEIQFLYENMNNLTSDKFGIGLDWPDRFNGGKCT